MSKRGIEIKEKQNVIRKVITIVITMAAVLAAVAAVFLYKQGKHIHNMTRCGCGK